MPIVVLASASPRRQDLLGRLGVPFDVRPADVDESPRPGETADDLVRRLAVDKAQAALAAAPEDDVVVLAADTLVSVDGQVLGKPDDEAHASDMLRTLSGSRHQVLTGVAVATSGSTEVMVEVVTTHVHMRAWTDEEIDAYVASGEPMDKAGSYAIQEIGDRFVTQIEGSFDNVVGLPVDVARRMLADAGIAFGDQAQPPEV